MTYAILKVSNGHYFIQEEAITDLNSARKKFHTACATMWNASDVRTGQLRLVDEQLNCVEGYNETIYHEQTPVQTQGE